MKNNTKCHIGLLLISSAAVVAGTALYLYFDENARENFEGMINREKAKMFVRHHLNGSKAMIQTVEKLSDKEVNTIVKLADSVDDIKENVGSTFDDWMESARKASHYVVDYVQDHL